MIYKCVVDLMRVCLPLFAARFEKVLEKYSGAENDIYHELNEHRTAMTHISKYHRVQSERRTNGRNAGSALF